MRRYYAYVNDHGTFDLFFYPFNEILYLCLSICTALNIIGKGILKKATFITYNTRLDLLHPKSRTDNSNWNSLFNFFLLVIYIYSIDIVFIVVSLDDFRRVFIHHMFILLVSYIKTYAYTFLLIIYICKKLSPKLRPRDFLVLLWLLKLILLISSDIESNPGPKPSGMGEQGTVSFHSAIGT